MKRYVSTSSIDHSEFVSIACINSPKNVTLSGSKRQISTLKSVFEREGVAAKVLRVNVAYHSKAMNEIAAEYGDLIGDVSTGDHKQDRPVIVSSVTGTEAIPDEMSTATYWVRNLTSPVRFSEALSDLCLLGKSATNGHGNAITDILEIGPHSTLKWLIKDTLALALSPRLVASIALGMPLIFQPSTTQYRVRRAFKSSLIFQSILSIIVNRTGSKVG